MVDRFLREVQRMHQLRRDISEMVSAEADELIRGLGDDAAEDWVFAARDAQLPPPDLSWCWLFLGGRGAGKSHSMSAAVHTAIRAGIERIHFIAPTTSYCANHERLSRCQRRRQERYIRDLRP